jgi:asparagine synthase (glutamine-hydrolysing)
MCGIAGIVSFNAPVNDHVLKLMGDALHHRGPDGEGFWYSEDRGVGFAHRRLAIIDLSDAASQPLQYLHYTIIFNGEIYNFRELRSQLQSHGYSFSSSGDTEVIPAAYDHWGLDFLHHLDGMFAFALYNNRTNLMLLARDRLGEKPLYYTHESNLLHPSMVNGVRHRQLTNGLLFASEMKALWAAGVERNLNDTMMLNYLGGGYVQNPGDKSETFYKGIFSLPPAHVLQVNPGERKINLLRWYDPGARIKLNAASINIQGNPVEKFKHLFFESVNRRLRSDMPVGSSLSGGIDSSAIVAVTNELLKKNKDNQFSSTCFTAVFPSFEKDEQVYSQLVAQNFNLKQYTVSPKAGDLIDNWRDVMKHQEEPVQSSSVITQYLVYRLAMQKGITVLLDGQGADEVLGGYKKYTHWYLQQLLRSQPSEYFREKKLFRHNHLLEQWGVKNMAAAFSPAVASRQLTRKAKKELRSHPFITNEYYHSYTNDGCCEKPVVDKLETLLFYNTFVFGLEELLRYADRNSMAHSREVRLPFLSHELVEFVFSLPSNTKMNNGFNKWILRKSMETFLPGEIVWRKDKIGYEPPQKLWMEQPVMQEMVKESRLKLVQQNILKPEVMEEPVEAKSAHEASNYDWRYLNAASIMDLNF